MAYHGTTAASSLANPPIRIGGGIGKTNYQSTSGGGGRQLWLYNSSNGTSEITAENFFTDAKPLGMVQGDMVMGVSATGSSAAVFVGVIGAVTTAGAAIASTATGRITST